MYRASSIRSPSESLGRDITTYHRLALLKQRSVVVILPLFMACHHDGSPARSNDVVDAGKAINGRTAEVDMGGDGGPVGWAYSWRCHRDHPHAELDHATVEEQDGRWRLCTDSLELDSPVPIHVVRDEQRSDEHSEWRIEIDRVMVDIRIDSEWASFDAAGWAPWQVETVVYPEAFGRSARRHKSPGIERQTDLLFSTLPSRRTHIHYGAATAEQSSVIDEIIDRMHNPQCEEAQRCPP